MTVPDDVVQRVARALNRDGHCGRCADYPNARHCSECINAAETALAELAKTHEITPRAVTPELRVGQVWSYIYGRKTRTITSIDDVFVNWNCSDNRIHAWATRPQDFLAWIARTGATLQETTK